MIRTDRRENTVERKTKALRRGRDLGLIFLFYAFAGWCYECLFLCPIREHQFVNRDNVLHRMIPIIPRRP